MKLALCQNLWVSMNTSLPVNGDANCITNATSYHTQGNAFHKPSNNLDVKSTATKVKERRKSSQEHTDVSNQSFSTMHLSQTIRTCYYMRTYD